MAAFRIHDENLCRDRIVWAIAGFAWKEDRLRDVDGLLYREFRLKSELFWPDRHDLLARHVLRVRRDHRGYLVRESFA